MNQLGAFVVLIGVGALVLAALGGVVAWWNEEGRRIRRGFRLVLRGDPHALVIAAGRGRGAGFNFTSNTMAVAWENGGWCLVYRIDELLGAELIVDGQVAARSYRGEARRPLDVMGGADRHVVLRLVFDDPRHPDFTLELWTAADAVRRNRPSAEEAVAEGNRWIARTESVFRRKPAASRVAQAPEPEPAPRPTAPRPPAPVPGEPHAPAARAVATPTDGVQDLPFAAAPPWDEAADDEDEARA